MDWRKVYDQFAGQQKLPLFYQSWYLDALLGKTGWACVYESQAQKVVAIWLYFPKKKWGIPYCVIPTLIKYLGPIYLAEVSDNERVTIGRNLYEKLPPHYSFTQQYLPHFTETICRKITEGFTFNKQTSFRSRSTFYWNLVTSEEALLAGMDGNYRRAIKKYESSVELSGFRPKGREKVVASFVELLESSMGKLAKHGLSMEQLTDVILHAEKASQGTLLLLYNHGELVSGSFVVWDEDKAYYLLAGNSHIHKKIYPGVQMAYYTALYLKKNTSVTNLDFVGSDIESIARIWRKIGAERKKYYLYTSKAWWFNLLQK